MIKTVLAAGALAVALGAAAEPYKVVVPLTPDDEGAMVRLVDYDNGAVIDSVLAGPESAVFAGEISEPVLARVMLEGKRLPVFILESGSISFNMEERTAYGSMLNDQLRDFGKAVMELQKQDQVADEAGREEIYKRYLALQDSVLEANKDNALGYMMFLDGNFSSLSGSEMREVLAKYPEFANKTRIQKLLLAGDRREATQVGGKFVDFEVNYNGQVSKLSDYVGKGKYVLVDFFASWCGPCMREIPVIKDIYNEWHKKGLVVLGVAVWDQAEDTERCIEQQQIPWPVMINAQSGPTDLYGIPGIPCLILFGPDGTIVSRDERGDGLKAAVARAMQQ